MLSDQVVLALLDAHKHHLKGEVARWEEARKMYACEHMLGISGDKSTHAKMEEYEAPVTESGGVFAFVDTMAASITPLNPQVTVKALTETAKKPAKARQLLIGAEMKRLEFGQLLRSLVVRSSVWPRAFLKTVWNQRDNAPDVLVIDPHYMFVDMTAKRWKDLRYIIEVTTLTEGEYQARVKNKFYKGKFTRKGKEPKPTGLPTWVKDTVPESQQKLREALSWYTIYEVYDFSDEKGSYRHFMEGMDEPLFTGPLPYKYVRNPYRMLTLNDNLKDIGGMSDADIVYGPVMRLSELQTIELRFAASSVPVTLLNEAAFDDPERAVDQITTCIEPGDVARVALKDNGTSLRDAISSTPTPTLSPSFQAMTQKLEEEIMYRLGQPQYSRGVTGGSDIATELALVDKVLNTRQGHRQGFLNVVIRWVAESLVGLYEQFLSGDTKIPIYDEGNQEYITVSAMEMGLRRKTGGEPPAIQYETIPYSPVEDSDTAVLAKLEPWLKALVGNQAVDQVSLLRAIVDRLRLTGEVKITQPAPMPQPGAPVPGGVGGAPALPQAPGGGITEQMAGGNMANGIQEPGIPASALGGMAGGPGIA